jgi:hypothetical protein
VAPDQLLANPKNFRVHPRHQQDALKGVLSEVGWVQDVIVNVRTNTVVDGHLRVMLALRHNEPTIPVKYVDLSQAEPQVGHQDVCLGTLSQDLRAVRHRAKHALGLCWPHTEAFGGGLH